MKKSIVEMLEGIKQKLRIESDVKLALLLSTSAQAVYNIKKGKAQSKILTRSITLLYTLLKRTSDDEAGNFKKEMRDIIRNELTL